MKNKIEHTTGDTLWVTYTLKISFAKFARAAYWCPTSDFSIEFSR